jgi:hypothetical protein
MVEDLDMDKLRTAAPQEATDLYGGQTFGWKAF